MREFGLGVRRLVEFSRGELAPRLRLVGVRLVSVGLLTRFAAVTLGIAFMAIAPAPAAATPPPSPLALLFAAFISLARLRLGLQVPSQTFLAGHGFLTGHGFLAACGFFFGFRKAFGVGRAFGRGLLTGGMRSAVFTSASASAAAAPSAPAAFAFLGACVRSNFAGCLRLFGFGFGLSLSLGWFRVFKVVFFLKRRRQRRRLLGKRARGFNRMHLFASLDDESLRRGHRLVG